MNDNSKIIKGIFNNGMATVFQKIVRILEQILLIPFFIQYWGTAYYGEWLTLSIIPSILAFSDLGIGSSVSNGFVLAYSQNNKDKAVSYYKNGLLIVSCTVILGIIITILGLVIIKTLKFFQASEIGEYESLLIALLLISARLITFFSQIYDGFYRASRKAALGCFISSLYSLFNLILGVLIVCNGGLALVYAFSLFLSSLLYNFLFALISKRNLNISSKSSTFDYSLLRSILKKGLGYLANPMWECIYFQGTTLVVRIVLGPQTVTVFNTVRTVCRSVNQLFGIVNASVFPELQVEYGKGNFSLVRRLFRIAIEISLILGVLGLSFLVLFGLDVFNWWTDYKLEVSYSLWILFMIPVFFNSIWFTSIIVYRMTNQPYHFACISISLSVISILISYFFSTQLGLVGIALSTGIFELCMALFVIPDAFNLLGIKISQVFTNFYTDFKFLVSKINDTVIKITKK